ncbi:hypothetical protein COL60_25050 [Bacillus pseudomycoides]|uniref:hypothetical protein n=1 Tax=Bacillus pseudomycoides TaxID=64104 RepID=UPI000BF6B422|nr:hypothetical protein [Bacillus pseudomycoides]PFZ03821.1 hypothetical protein COL60_25050 [Bacillus pseudomycoides]
MDVQTTVNNKVTELLNHYFHRVKVNLVEEENQRELYEHELINELFPLFNVAGNDNMNRDFLIRFRLFVREIISEQEQKMKELEKTRDEEINVFDLVERKRIMNFMIN